MEPKKLKLASVDAHSCHTMFFISRIPTIYVQCLGYLFTEVIDDASQDYEYVTEEIVG